MPLIFKREPDNQYDSNAIAVWVLARAMFFFTSEVQIGHLNAEIAKEMTYYLKNGGSITGRITEITGGSENKPTKGVNIIIKKEV